MALSRRNAMCIGCHTVTGLDLLRVCQAGTAGSLQAVGDTVSVSDWQSMCHMHSHCPSRARCRPWVPRVQAVQAVQAANRVQAASSACDAGQYLCRSGTLYSVPCGRAEGFKVFKTISYSPHRLRCPGHLGDTWGKWLRPTEWSDGHRACSSLVICQHHAS